ncbi:hypothetical protein [Pontibacter rugosus]|uniref:Uncharacterized protein n=1 Tax=Pontibacter rugosus TaxID=1745966 RepID=A0ABW3SQZ7_9BACT
MAAIDTETGTEIEESCGLYMPVPDVVAAGAEVFSFSVLEQPGVIKLIAAVSSSTGSEKVYFMFTGYVDKKRRKLAQVFYNSYRGIDVP